MATEECTSSPPAHGQRRERGSCRVPGSLAGVTCGVREQWPRRRGGSESLPFPVLEGSRVPGRVGCTPRPCRAASEGPDDTKGPGRSPGRCCQQRQTGGALNKDSYSKLNIHPWKTPLHILTRALKNWNGGCHNRSVVAQAG